MVRASASLPLHPFWPHQPCFSHVGSSTAELVRTGIPGSHRVLVLLVESGRAFATSEHALALEVLIVAKLFLGRLRHKIQIRVQLTPKRAKAGDLVVFALVAALGSLVTAVIAPLLLLDALVLPVLNAGVEGGGALLLALRQARARWR